MLGLTLLLIATVAPGRFAQASVTLGVAHSFGAVSTASGTTLSAAPVVATSAGDLLVAAIKDRGTKNLATVTGIHDFAGNVWARAAKISQGGQAEGEIWYAANAAAITTPGQVTVTVSECLRACFHGS